MVEVWVKIISRATTDAWMRWHGVAIDQPLNDDFWITQPKKTVARSWPVFAINWRRDWPVGSTHTVEYATSGYVPDCAWHAKIFINNELVAEGDVGRHAHLKAKFEVKPPPPPPPPPPPTPKPTSWPFILLPASYGGALLLLSYLELASTSSSSSLSSPLSS